MEKKKRSGRSVGLGLLVLVVLLFLGAAAQAKLITIAIEGVVDSVGDDENVLGGAISVGDAITGYYNFDTDAIDLDPSDETGTYLWETEPYGIFLEINGVSFRTNPEDVRFFCVINNFVQPSPSDHFIVDSMHNITSLSGASIDHIVWGLWDPSGSVFDSDVLLNGAPDLGFDWDDNSIGIGLSGRNGIGGHITSAYIIPEPMTIVLFGLGGLLLKKS